MIIPFGKAIHFWHYIFLHHYCDSINPKLTIYIARKIIFSFSKYSEKTVFSKKLRRNMIFLVLSKKMIFLFHEIIFLGDKMKDDLSQKTYMEIYFLQIFRKDGILKKFALEYDLSCCVIWKDDISFFRKYDLIL